jgi:thioesterase DpgC
MVTALTAYDSLTQGRSRFVRVDELCSLAAEAYPGLLPSREDLAREAPLLQKDKQGLEKQQGEFLAAVLADPVCGSHLCHAMPAAAGRVTGFS